MNDRMNDIMDWWVDDKRCVEDEGQNGKMQRKELNLWMENIQQRVWGRRLGTLSINYR